MTTIPVELAEAREACTQAWNRYFVVTERPHTYDEYHQALNEAGASDDLCSDLYRRWQAVGGTSDIESIVEAEKFLGCVEQALTDPAHLATAMESDWGEPCESYKHFAQMANTKGDMSRWARGG
jgi:hypothetical protein